jgi:hypothetical protein
MSKVDPKAMAMEQLVRHMERDCPKCVGCRETKLHEQEDHMRMAMLLGVSCKQNVRNNGDMVRCPDGFYGVYDATKKEVKEVRLEMPTVTFGAGMTDPRSVVAPRWTPIEEAEKVSLNDEFMRQYMTDPSLAKDDMGLMRRMIEEKAKRAAEEQEKILRRKIMLSEFDGDGIGKISAGLADMLGKKQIPTDRTSFPPVKPVNKDVPATADEDAW